eukprot:6214814-Pleurochrysis_carterae.AAC.3
MEEAGIRSETADPRAPVYACSSASGRLRGARDALRGRNVTGHRRRHNVRQMAEMREHAASRTRRTSDDADIYHTLKNVDTYATE